MLNLGIECLVCYAMLRLIDLANVQTFSLRYRKTVANPRLLKLILRLKKYYFRSLS